MTTITVSALAVTLLMSLVIPILTGLLTKAEAPTALKQVLTMALAGVAGFIATRTGDDGTAAFTTEHLAYALISEVGAIASYLGVYKSHDLNAKTAPGIGIG